MSNFRSKVQRPTWCVYYSTIQISFSDLKTEKGNHLVISIFYFQFEKENQKTGSIFGFSFAFEIENQKKLLFSFLHFEKSKA